MYTCKKARSCAGANKAKFFSDDGKNKIINRVGQITCFRRRLAIALADRTAGCDRLVKLIILACSSSGKEEARHGAKDGTHVVE